MDAPAPGTLFRHYKGNLYRVVAIAVHSETLEPLVVYRDERHPEKMWARPLAMWQETVTVDGRPLPRFALVGK